MTAATPRKPGELLCGAAILLAVGLMIVHALRLGSSLAVQDVPFALAGAVLGALAVDGLTGLVHWACDTWGDERTPWLGPTLIYAFREHHRDPQAMLAHPWASVNREPGVAAAVALVLFSLPATQQLLAGHAFVDGFLCAFIAYGAGANQIHCWAHTERPPLPVRLAQRCGLLLSPERHARHHCGSHRVGYCISTGWLNPALDGIGFWRGLEKCMRHAVAVHGTNKGNRRLERI